MDIFQFSLGQNARSEGISRESAWQGRNGVPSMNFFWMASQCRCEALLIVQSNLIKCNTRFASGRKVLHGFVAQRCCQQI